MKYTFHIYSLPDEKTITVTLKGLSNTELINPGGISQRWNHNKLYANQ